MHSPPRPLLTLPPWAPPSRFTFETFIYVYLTHSSVTAFEKKKKKDTLK